MSDGPERPCETDANESLPADAADDAAARRYDARAAAVFGCVVLVLAAAVLIGVIGFGVHVPGL